MERVRQFTYTLQQCGRGRCQDVEQVINNTNNMDVIIR
jgi:hypothetical protein